MSKKKLETLVIDRTKWARGFKAGSLLDLSGKMCCLGFYAKACGNTDDQIIGRGMPEQRDFDVARQTWSSSADWLFNKEQTTNSEVCIRLAKCNDNPRSDDKQKERVIKKTFLKHGVKVKFIG